MFGNKDKSSSEDDLLIDRSSKKKSLPEGKTSSTKKLDKYTDEKSKSQSKGKNRKIRKIKKIKKNIKPKVDNKAKLNYNVDDLKNGIKLMELSEEDLDRGMEIITRTKKYMSRDERKMLIKMESILDLVKGIKKLNEVEVLGDEDDIEFFRSMDEEDKKNMMIKEILEVFPEKKKESVEKAISMKKKIDLLAELFLPDSEEGGFSLGSLVDINNLGSINNIKLLGSLLRGDSLEEDEDDDNQQENAQEYSYIQDEGDVED